MSNQRNQSQSGVVMVLFVLSLPVILGFAALAIDLGRLYSAQQNLNKATRVAAMVSLNFMSLRGWGPLVTDNRDTLGYQTGPIVTSGAGAVNPPGSTSANQMMREEMAKAVISTLRQYYPNDFSNDPSSGVTSSPYLQFEGDGDWSSSVPLQALNLSNSSVNLSIRYAIPTLLYGQFMQLSEGTSCARQESGEVRCFVQNSPNNPAGLLKPLNLFLLLDTSGSMAGTTGTDRAKIDVLKEAVVAFIDMFNPFQDKIALIDYGTTVKTQGALQLFDSASGAHLDIKNDVAALQASGQTNPCDALVRSIDAAATAQINPDLATAIVLFSDGSPNISRLKYCDFQGGSCNVPSRLSSALGSADPEQGWYSWITTWGRRRLASCPNGVSSDPTQAVRYCDPVYGWPELVYGGGSQAGQSIPLASIQANLRLNENGSFIWKNGPTQADEVPISTADPTLPGGPYVLQFESLTREQNNYLWNGPSYLVHASTPPNSARSLLDRIPATASPTPITCGAGSRPSYPGSTDSTSPTAPLEMYTHSRYFGSRILNYNWALDPGGASSLHDNQRIKVGLDTIQPSGQIAPPAYFTERNQQELKNNPSQSPGCLTNLNTQLPFTADSDEPANIFVGERFLSNTDDSTIENVGEVVKTTELPYYCALRAADHLRSRFGAIVFVVGLGPRAADIYGESCNDPLQNPLDFDSRKDNFLRRLAFAPESLERSQVDDFMNGQSASWEASNDFGFSSRTLSCQNHPLNGIQVELGYGETLDGSAPRSRTPLEHEFTPRHFGAYYGCNDSSQLNEVFGNIAKQILLRLAM
jgi:hypothetical protein